MIRHPGGRLTIAPPTDTAGADNPSRPPPHDRHRTHRPRTAKPSRPDTHPGKPVDSCHHLPYRPPSPAGAETRNRRRRHATTAVPGASADRRCETGGTRVWGGAQEGGDAGGRRRRPFRGRRSATGSVARAADMPGQRRTGQRHRIESGTGSRSNDRPAGRGDRRWSPRLASAGRFPSSGDQRW